MKDSRILREWLDASGNKIAVGNSTVAQSIPTKLPNQGYKEKFQKLLDYHKKHVGNDTISTEIKKLNGYGFEYRETKLATNSTSETITIIEVDIHDDGEWYAYIWRDGKCIDLDHKMGFDNLLSMLGNYLNIPSINSNEYQELLEWVDKSGSRVSFSNAAINSRATSSQSNEVVYIWDMYMDYRDRGTWCSAEKNNGEYDGFVFKSEDEALRYGREHLYELDDSGELRGDPDDYDIDTVAIPKSEVSDYTLRFSGL